LTGPFVRALGRVDYGPTVDAMRAYTETRTEDTPDEIWLCEHPPVYTQGLAGRAEHVRDAHGIPVVATNRGGQVTYHGPGQVVAYPLIDLKRLGIYVKDYVYRLEHCVIKTLEDRWHHRAARCRGAGRVCAAGRTPRSCADRRASPRASAPGSVRSIRSQGSARSPRSASR
jgi:lipoyl(octanoyl) transferase